MYIANFSVQLQDVLQEYCLHTDFATRGSWVWAFLACVTERERNSGFNTKSCPT